MNQIKGLEEEYIIKYFSDYTIKGELQGSSAAKLFILEKDGIEVVLKIAATNGVDNGNKKLKDEINFLEEIKHDKFVNVIDKKTNGAIIWYTMPYYKGSLTINEVINVGEDADQIIKSLFEFMFKNFYTTRQKVTKNIDIETNFKRVRKRLEESCKLNYKMNDLIHAKNIMINGKVHENYSVIFKKILSRYSDIVLTDFHSLIHQDLTVENVLVNRNSNKYKIIDPRGPSNAFGDYVYDLAKFSYSLNGFTLIKYGNYKLKEVDKLSYVFGFDEKFKSKYMKQCKKYYVFLDKCVPTYIDSDPFWKYRLLFTEACHYLSNVPCLLIKEGGFHRALALYIHGISLLNDFITIIEGDLTCENHKLELMY